MTSVVAELQSLNKQAKESPRNSSASPRKRSPCLARTPKPRTQYPDSLVVVVVVVVDNLVVVVVVVDSLVDRTRGDQVGV